MEATTKQITYIEALKGEAVSRVARVVGQKVDARALLEAAFAVSLPAPTTSQEASDQIDALKVGMIPYAREHRDWADPIVAKVKAAPLPTVELSVPDFSIDPPTATAMVDEKSPAEFVAMVLA